MTEPFRTAARARTAARSRFDQRLSQIRSDLEVRGIGGRVADKLGSEAKAAALMGLDVARESKGIIAATITALALWSFRNPIIDWAAGFLPDEFSHDKETDDA